MFYEMLEHSFCERVKKADKLKPTENVLKTSIAVNYELSENKKISGNPGGR